MVGIVVIRVVLGFVDINFDFNFFSGNNPVVRHASVGALRLALEDV